MIITVEISMYPFQEKYKSLIQDFVKKLGADEKLRVDTGPTSTVVVGEFVDVMERLTEILPWSYAELGRAVYVMKFIPDYDPD